MAAKIRRDYLEKLVHVDDGENLCHFCDQPADKNDGVRLPILVRFMKKSLHLSGREKENQAKIRCVLLSMSE